MTSKNVVCKVKAILSRFGLNVLLVTMVLIPALTNRCWSNENSSIKIIMSKSQSHLASKLRWPVNTLMSEQNYHQFIHYIPKHMF